MPRVKDEVFVDLLQQIIDSGLPLLRARYGIWAFLKEGRTDPEFIPSWEELGYPALPESMSTSKFWKFMELYEDMPRPFLGADETTAETFLSVPLPLRRGIAGFLFVAGKEDTHGFGSPDIRLAELFVRMADELFQGHKTSIETRRGIRFMREALDEGSATCITDASRTIIFWNRGAQDLFGYTEREALGQSFVRLLVPPEQLPRWEKQYPPGVYGTVIGGNVAHFEGDRLHKDGRRIPVTISISPFCYQIAGIIACVCFIRFEASRN